MHFSLHLDNSVSPGFDPPITEQAVLLTCHKDTLVGNFTLVSYASAAAHG